LTIIIDLNHPADFHFFKHIIKEMEAGSYTFIITAREKDCLFGLLDHAKIDYISRGRGGGNYFLRAIYLLLATYKLHKLIKKHHVALSVSFGSPYLAIASRLAGVQSITIDDTEKNHILHSTYSCFTTTILTPHCFEKKINDKQVYFPGQKELAYLHPDVFKPDKKAVEALGIKQGELFTIIRLVRKNATHDIGHSGFRTSFVEYAVKQFLSYGKVFITAEYSLPPALNQYVIQVHPSQIHHVMAFASLFYGESTTMAAEAAIMGVPSILVDDHGRGYTKYLEREHQLLLHFDESNEGQLKSIDKATEILASKGIRKSWKERAKRFTDQANNMSAYMVDYIKNRWSCY